MVGAGPVTAQPPRTTPTASSRAWRSTPTTSPARCAGFAAYGRARHQGGDDVPGRLQPAGAGERPPLLPDLPDVHRPRHPDRVQRRHRGTALPVDVPGRHALRPGLLRLPGAAHRHAARRGAVGGACGQAHAQVAGALLHDRARSPRSTTRRRSSTTRTRAAPTRSCTPGTTRWACRSSASSTSCRTCRSATTCGRSSSATTRYGSSSSTKRRVMSPISAGSTTPAASTTSARSRRSSRCCAADRRRCASASNVRAFEQGVAELFGKRRGVMCNSGSSALYLAVELLGLEPGDEVITSAVTFSTDIAPIVRAGLVPVFVDVEPDTYNVDVDAIEAMIGPRHEGDPRAEPDRQRARLGPHPRDRRRARAAGDRGLVRRARLDAARHADRHPLRHLGDVVRPLAHHHRGRHRRHGLPRRRRAGRPLPAAAALGPPLGGADLRLPQGRRPALLLVDRRRLEYDNLFIFDELGWNFEPSELVGRVRTRPARQAARQPRGAASATSPA